MSTRIFPQATKLIKPSSIHRLPGCLYCTKLHLLLIFVFLNDMVSRRNSPPMNFQDLHELLRVELLRRIERGALTGSRLAHQAGFQQAHISNFLNRKRSLSLEGLDRVLASQNLTIDQILPLELTAAAATPVSDPTEVVPVVSASIAMDDARVPPSAII